MKKIGFEYSTNAWKQIEQIAKKNNETPEQLLVRAQAIGLILIKYNKYNYKDE